MVRIILDKGNSSGGRKSWYKQVNAIDMAKTNGYAFLGDFLNSGIEIDIPSNIIIVEGQACGSVKHPFINYVAYTIDEKNELLQFAEGTKENFLSFRDIVAKKLLETKNKNEMNGVEPILIKEMIKTMNYEDLADLLDVWGNQKVSDFLEQLKRDLNPPVIEVKIEEKKV